MMDDRGQVGVVVAILVVTLIVAVLVIIQVNYVPKWMKEREAEHMDLVVNQFAGLKYSLDLQAMERSSSPLTNSITLGSKEMPYFVTSRAFGSLQILSNTASNFSISISGDGMRAESMLHNVSNNNISYVLSISSFELYIWNLQPGDTYNVSFATASISARVEEFINESFCKIILTVINETNVLYNQSVAVGIERGGSYTVNLLNNDYKFSTKILPYLSTPFNITFNTSSNGSFLLGCMQYTQQNVFISYSFGTIKYEADNAYFVDQKYIYEGGAVILSQETGNTILLPPSVYVSNVSRTLNMTLIDIVGIAGKTGATGYGTYSIRTNFSLYITYNFIMDSLAINITSNYYSAWKKFLDDRFNESGITYQVTEGNGYVVFNFSNITFSLNIAKIYAQIGPGWVR